MKFINEHVKRNEFKPVYLLYGEEDYLKRQCKDKLKSAVIGEDTMNYSYFEGKKTDVKAMIDIGNTLPFFAERRMLVVEESGMFKASNDEMTEFIKNIPEYLFIIFIETEIDKRNKLYKAVSEKGYVSEMKFQEESTLMKWIGGLLHAENKSIERDALELFVARTGTRMDNMKSELEKLLCYSMDKPDISIRDVEEICTMQTTNKVFDMITAISMKKAKKALDIYYDLLLLKEPPMRILYLMTRQFNMMLQVKELVMGRYDGANIAKQLGIAGFLVNKYITQSKGFTMQEIREALESFVSTEESVKTGLIEDKTGLELLIIKYSKGEAL